MAIVDESKYIKIVEIRQIVGKHILRKTFEQMFPEYPLVRMKNTYCFTYEGNREEIIKQISDVFIEHYFPQSITDPYEKVDYWLNRYDDENTASILFCLKLIKILYMRRLQIVRVQKRI